MVDYSEVVQENFRELRSDIKLIRERMHRNENNLASSSALLAETTTSLGWAIEKLEFISEKIEKSEADTAREREEKLKEIIKEKIGYIQKIKSFFISEKFVLYLVALLYFADKVSFASHVDKIRGLTGA